jgi:hypothetical protein
LSSGRSLIAHERMDGDSGREQLAGHRAPLRPGRPEDEDRSAHGAESRRGCEAVIIADIMGRLRRQDLDGTLRTDGVAVALGTIGRATRQVR